VTILFESSRPVRRFRHEIAESGKCCRIVWIHRRGRREYPYIFVRQPFERDGGTLVFDGLSDEVQQGIPALRSDLSHSVKVESCDSRR
jgi:hypothetical protein